MVVVELWLSIPVNNMSPVKRKPAFCIYAKTKALISCAVNGVSITSLDRQESQTQMQSMNSDQKLIETVVFIANQPKFNKNACFKLFYVSLRQCTSENIIPNSF